MRLRPLSVAAACLAVITLAVKFRFESSRPESAVTTLRANGGSLTPVELRRAPDNTFLTFPEWYLVYSPREYANFLVDRPPSQFPFVGHLGQFWQGYRGICVATEDAGSFNLDYHVMIWVIGLSTSAEYGLKALYETVFGRVTEIVRGSEMTAEDRLAATVAREYADFLDVEPWYKFDFVSPLSRLWSTTDWWGPHPLRKWERRYFLTSEYVAKALYGWAIQQSSESSYGVESPWTAVVLDRTPLEPSVAVKVLEAFPDGAVLAQVPRYQAFTGVAAGLAKSGASFLEIAGNRGPILVSAVVDETYEPADVDVVFVQPIMTEPGRKRIVFTVSVPHLVEALRRLDDPQIKLEHIYDF